MFILVGELEFNENHFHPCGGPQSFLFVSTQLSTNMDKREYTYAMSPYPQPHMAHLGDTFKTYENLSVTEFLQRFVDEDEQIGRGVIKSLDKCKVRLKGMTEWIERNTSPLENYRVVEINN